MATRALLRAARAMPARGNMLRMTSMLRPTTFLAQRTFSALSETTSSLSQCLKNELVDAESHLQEFTEEEAPNGFARTDGPEKYTLLFTKTVGGEEITLTVNVQDIEENNENEEDSMASDEEGRASDRESGDEEEPTELGVSATIELRKASGETINIDAIAWAHSGWGIRQIGSDIEGYQAEGNDLDQALLDSFYDYLEERGVNAELATHVAGCAYMGESKLYHSWIQDMSKYMAAK